MAERDPGRLAFETFAARMKSRLHLKWDYELFSREEKEAWAEVERAVLEEAARSPTVRPDGPGCPYCLGELLEREEGPSCAFPPDPHRHLRCSKCSQEFVHPAAPEATAPAQ